MTNRDIYFYSLCIMILLLCGSTFWKMWQTIDRVNEIFTEAGYMVASEVISGDK